jgi:hypothetical protein
VPIEEEILIEEEASIEEEVMIEEEVPIEEEAITKKMIKKHQFKLDIHNKEEVVVVEEFNLILIQITNKYRKEVIEEDLTKE